MAELTPTPWHWVIHDSSMASIEGPRGMEDHILSVSPCKHCRGDEWKWASCTNPTEANAAFIVKAVNNHDALVKHLDHLATICCDEDALRLLDSLRDPVGSSQGSGK